MRPCLVATGFVKDGALHVARRDAFKAAFAQWPNSAVVIRVEQDVYARSVALNAYYWGAVIHLISEDTGYTPDEAHDEMKQLHLPKRFAAMRRNGRIKGVRVFEGSTTDLSNEEEWEYIENIQRWGAQREPPLVIPDPVLV
jgi:hypothetical protein